MINVFEYITPENIHKCERCVVEGGLAVTTGFGVWRLVFAEGFAVAAAWVEERTKLRKAKAEAANKEV